MTRRAVDRSIDRTDSVAPGQSVLRWLWYGLGLLALVLAYVLSARVGLLWRFPNTAATPVWPPTGIAIAVLILGGLRWWPGVVVGAFLANRSVGLEVPFAATIAAGNTLEAVAAAWFTARYCGGRAVLDRPTDVFKYAILAAGVSTAIAATVGASVEPLRARNWGAVGETWLIWWLGDAVSAVTVAPLILVMARHRLPVMDRRRWLEAGAILMVIGAVTAFIFSGMTEGSSFNDPLSFMVVPLVLWASFRFGLHGAVLLGLVLSVLAIAGTLAGYGPFAVGSRTYDLMLLQAFLGTATLSGLVVAATEGQRRGVVRDLEASETEYRAIFELAGSGKALLEPVTGRVARVNRKLCAITGFAPGDLIGRTYTELTHPDDRGWSVEAAGRMSRGEDYFAQARWRRKDGSWIWVNVAATLVPRGLGRPPVAALVVQDITASKRSEAVLRESEERFRLLADSAPALIWVNGPFGCEFVNRGYMEFLGVELEELLGDGWRRFIHPDDVDAYVGVYLRAVAVRGPFEAEFRFRRHDGEYRWMRSAGRARIGPDDAVLGYTGVTVDVTERRRAEEALRVRARQQQAVAHLGEVALRERDLQRVFDQATETTAHTLEVPLAKVQELLPGGDRVLLRAGVGWRAGVVGVATVDAGRSSQAGYTLESGVPVVVTDLVRDGRFRGSPLLIEHGVVSGMSCVIRGGDGAPWGVLGTHSTRRVEFTRDDVSFLVSVANILGEAVSRARGELELRRSEERYRAVVEGQAEMVCRFRPSGEILFANEAYARARGVSSESLQGADFWPFINEQDRPAVREMLDRLRPDDPNIRIENRFQTAGGTRWTLWTNRALAFDAAGRATEVQSSGIDITDRKEAERALARRVREQTALYGLTDRLHRASTPTEVYDAAMDGIIEALACDRASILLFDDHGVMRFVAWRGLSEGYRRAVEGHSPWKRGESDLRPVSIADPGNASVPERLGPVLREEGVAALGFIPLVTHDGLIGKLTVYYNAPHAMSREETDLAMTIGRQLAFGVQRLRDEEERVRAERELARHRDHLETLVRERTAELESSRERVRFAERMAALGALSAGLGHDMGNLLLPIRVRLEALERSGLPETEREHVEAIRTASTYLQRLANGLRMLAVDPWRRAPRPSAELGEWWTDAAPVLKAALPSGIRFESEFPADPVWVRMSKPGLTQAVFNLVQNAGEAMRSRGLGTVRVAVDVRDGSAHLSVADDGPGMTPEVRARCMEPFFTTKTRGLSTGLGLSLVFALVGEAGGEVRLESETGRGTTFTLVLPLGVPAEAPRIDADRLAVVQVKQPHLRAFIHRELRHLRYRVSDDVSATATADLLVLDHAEHAAPVKPGGMVVALDALDGPAGAPAGPAVSVIRRRLEEVAGKAEAPGAREGRPWPA